MTASFSTRNATRDKRWLVFFCLTFLSFSVSAQTTLYTYQSGTWNTIDVWTTDPGGTTLVGSKVPGDGDAVVVLPSRTLTLAGNIDNTGLSITIQPGGTFDASSFSFSNPLAGFSGQGTYRLSSANFPSAVINTFTVAGGGTVEYYNGVNFILPASQTSYFNLIINCAGFSATQLNNLTINGNLSVLTGIYRINDDNAARRTLIVNGDVEVSAGASLITGTGNTTTTSNPLGIDGGTSPFLDYYTAQAHRVEIFGNLTNNGTVRFTNQGRPVFNAFPADGFASVYFRGAADKTITCNGTTDFYNLIVDKGTDQTYVLSVNSTAYDRFRIFGANVAGEIARSDASNPDIRKALWIRNGTLRLNGYAFIPSLVEGAAAGSGDYIIPGNGALVIGGPDVVVMGTIDDYRPVELAYSFTPQAGLFGVTTGSLSPSGILLYGKLEVNEGKLYVGEYGRVVYNGSSAAAQFIINGGTIDIKQFQSVIGGGKTAYWQTGGTLVLRGRFPRALLYTSLANMISSIGNSNRLNNIRVPGPDPGSGTLNIDQPENIFRMEGGSIEIYDVTGTTAPSNAIEINSDPANISVTGGTINIIMVTGSVPLQDIDFGIKSNASFYNAIITKRSGSIKSILTRPFATTNNLTLANTSGVAGSVLDAAGFNVKIGGDFLIQANAGYSPGSNRTVFNGSGAQNFTSQVAISPGLNKLIIDKNSGILTLGSNFTVGDSLVINSGTLNDGGYTLQVAGNVYNAGSHTGTGKIQLNGTSIQYLSAAPGSSSVLGNIEIANSSGSAGSRVATLLSDLSVTSLSLVSERVFYIGSNLLTLGAGGFASSQTYGITRMIQTNGLSSDKGLKRYINNSYNGITILFPVGCEGGDLRTAVDFFPGRLNVGTVSANGYFTVVPVSEYHPSCTSKGDALDFYWRTKVSGLVTSGTSRLEFDYWTKIDNKYNGPYYLLTRASTWATGITINNSPTIRYDGLGAAMGDFTAGQKTPFKNPTTYYSRQSGNWNASAGGFYTTWSLTGHSGAAVPTGTGLPQNYDNVVVGGIAGSRNDSVKVTAAITAAVISIRGSFTSNNRSPVLDIENTTGHTIDIVRGAGKFCTSISTLPTADFGEFLDNDTAVFNYYGTTSYTLPAIASYPNLLITGTATKYLRNGLTIVKKNLMIADGTVNNVLSLNGTSGDLIVYGDVSFRNGGKLVIPNTNVSRNISIYGNINFKFGNTSHSNSIQATDGAQNAVHIFNFFGRNITSGASSLLFDQGNNKVDLYIRNPGNVNIFYGSGSLSLNRLIIQKGVVTDTVFFRNNFTLNPSDNASASKSLTLNTGTLILSDPANGSASAINLNLSSGGTSYFNINSSSRLILRNGSKIRITGTGTGAGIRLDGLLKAEDASEIDLADGTRSGYIEYTGSGNASIILSGASVLKVAQVRRSLSLSTGLLNYYQSGSSAATIFGTGAATTRAKFEVTGAGSSFNMTGTSTLTIINGGGTTFGDLYLRPEASALTGGSIIFGTGISSQVYKVDASVPLFNMILNATGSDNEVQLMVNPLVLKGSLTLTDANRLFANNLNVTIGGDFTQNGTYTAGTNTTIFNGATQLISGANDPLFNNLTVSPSVKLVLARYITIGSSLDITSGILETGIYNVTVRGNVNNNGIYTNDPSGTSKLYLNGTVVQAISGNGSFGRMELDNVTGGARLLNDLTLSEDLTLLNGIIDINQYSLTLGPESDISPAVFGTGRMIKSDGVFSNGGITKYFNAGFTGTFVYPSGVAGKYTPATLTVNATNAGWVRINVINQRHPATLLPFDVLNYYWEAESSITGFEGSLTVNYDASDVTGDESQYVAGRLVVPPGTGWSKATAGPSTDYVNETAHTIFFSFPSGTANLGGQYTAGQTTDLPNTIPVYRSKNATGNWNVKTDWTPESPDGGPNGFAVIIEPGTVMNTSTNKRFAFRTTINGTLKVGTTYGHNLGSVDGTGTLSLEQANLPAGDFSSFISCEGGTLEYDGGSYTIVADRISAVKNIIFKGTGTKTLPDKDLVICNTLEIKGPILDNHYNRKLSIGGSMILTSGSFLSGTGAGATVTFNGTAPQTLSGFRSANQLNNLEISNAAGLTLNSAIMMKGNLIMTKGVIHTTADSLLKMTGQTASSTAGSSFSFVNGPMSKNQLGGIDFTFPVGKGSRYGKLGLVTPQSGIWEAEYYNSPYPNATSPDATVAGTLVKAGSTEYWRIKSPADGKTATVKLRWDNQSDISPLTTSGGINDIRVAEYDGADWREKTSAVPTGNDTDGTVQTSANIPVSNTGHPRYYTLGSASTVKPTILLGIPDPVCKCTTIAYLPYLSTSGAPNEYVIDFNAAAAAEGFADVLTWTSLPVSQISIAVPAAADPGVYSATIRVRASASAANVSIPYPFSVIVLPDISWRGTSGTSWNTPGNWSCGILPTGSDPVVIPNETNDPVLDIGFAGAVNDLTIESGAALTVAGTLSIAGAIANNGIFTATNGRIVLNGTVSQLIPAGLFAGNTIRDLTVNNIAGAVLQGPLNVTGIVRLQSGDLASAGNLTLVSDALGTALIDGSGTGNVTGNVTMQRYLSSRFGYKYFSSPFQNATVSQFSEEINLAAAFSPIYRYDENRTVGTPPVSVSGWVSYKLPINPLILLSGYSINTGAVSTPLTVAVTGIVNNDSRSVTLYNHNLSFTKGFNLVGNPYPSPIDWNAAGWTKTNIDNALYFFNASTTDQYGGTYSTYINGESTGGATNIIASMQGFFVHVSNGSWPVEGTLAVTNNVRVNNLSPIFFKKASNASSLERSRIKLSASFSGTTGTDPIVIYIDENGTNDFDSNADGLKFFNTDNSVPNFYSFSNNGSLLSINALPEPEERMQPVSLGIVTRKNGEVVFRLEEISGIFNGADVYFFDSYTGSSIKLASGMEYRAALNTGTYNSRFFLSFDNLQTETRSGVSHELPARIYSSGIKVIAEVNCLRESHGILTIYNLTGQAVYNHNITGNGHHEFNLNVKDGIYIAKFDSGNFNIRQKIFISSR